MRKRFSPLLGICVLVSSIAGFAQEPANLSLHKKDLIRYYDSGAYANDLHRAIDNAMHYLETRLATGDFHGKKPAIVFDIDDTSLSNYPFLRHRDFGGALEDFRQNEALANDPPILPTLKLYRYAKAHGVAIFFITGRFERERTATEYNLKRAGFDHWDGLVLRTPSEEKYHAADYKTPRRKQIADNGYDILLNIGDQQSDLRGGYADKTIKLPNPFYLIP